MAISLGDVRSIDESERTVIRFGDAAGAEGDSPGPRMLWLADAPAFELSFWCGSEPILFERKYGANRTCSISELSAQLMVGIDDPNDSVSEPFLRLLPAGRYLPMLFEIQPRLIYPGQPGDYFSHEQVATWGVSAFRGLPESPHTPYYRTFETPVGPSAHLYEFIAPMVPPSWNDPARVEQHEMRLAETSASTAVAVSILDVCAPATDGGDDVYEHWGLTHFLLDGHHKIQASSRSRRPLRLLTLLSLDHGLSSQKQVRQLPRLRRGAHQSRR